MATETATIRVARDTRDLLAEQARERGMSLAALLAVMAREHELEAIFQSERKARLTEVGDPEAEGERRLWEQTLEDDPDFE